MHRGIDMHMMVYYCDRDMTEEEIDTFVHGFLDFVEGQGLVCGGGFKPVDLDEEPEEAKNG